ncbi:nitroreductase family protein [Moraxella atlantae]|uniref:Nitroreductase family n=1 Tax=Faucicola atlantae TaxID=34059 RepID=A0A378Q1D6_9GAMM|nr:nitroreductase family protein [Moraxella atlantae]OPH36709.1 nitroreductase family protein [Moraxella atlantae]STY94663.1 Nitroreductase family [Moraxella atlantae]
MTTPTLQHFQQAAKLRRSVYALNDQLPISKADVESIVREALLHTPSSFNSQSTRLVVLWAEAHQKFWQLTEDALRNIVNDDEQFQSTAQKMAGFKAAAGTILFYEDQAVVRDLQERFPTYADSFSVWAEHSDAMHQYVVWTALAAAGVGANLQHYAPVVAEQVRQTWDINPNWQLIAQLVFGGVEQPAGDKEFDPIEPRLQVFDQ